MAKKTRARTTESAAGRISKRPKRRVESYADWMTRVDAQVEEAARKIKRQPPTYAWLQRVAQPQVSAELRQCIEKYTQLLQRTNAAWAQWLRLQTSLNHQRDELIKADNELQQAAESIRRELHLDCES